MDFVAVDKLALMVSLCGLANLIQSKVFYMW